jgi:hypothetical protein
MRRNATVAAALVAAIALAGCSGNTSALESRIDDLENRVAALEQGASTAQDSPDGSTASTDDGQAAAVTIGEATFDDKTYGDGRVIIVPMAFTNNGDDATAFSIAVKVDVYQDGAALSSSVPASWSGGLPQTWTNMSTQIQPGATIDVANAYELRSTSPVTVEVRPLGSDDVIAQRVFEVS